MLQLVIAGSLIDFSVIRGIRACSRLVYRGISQVYPLGDHDWLCRGRHHHCNHTVVSKYFVIIQGTVLLINTSPVATVCSCGLYFKSAWWCRVLQLPSFVALENDKKNERYLRYCLCCHWTIPSDYCKTVTIKIYCGCFVYFRLLCNRYMVIQPPRGQDVEWGYSFDVHLNAFFPLLMILHFFQLPFLNGTCATVRWVLSFKLFTAVCFYIMVPA